MTRYSPQWLQADSYPASIDRRLLGALWPTAASVGGLVTFSAGMVLSVAAGQVAVPTGNNTGSALCSWDAPELVTLPAAPSSGLNRIDVVIAQLRSNDIDGGANNDFVMSSVTGVAAASPAVPAVPANAVALAQVLIVGGSASITPGNITDRRPSNLAIPPLYPAPWAAYMNATPAPPVNKQLPLGLLGIVRYTATSGAVGATLTPIPGANVTVNVAAGRRIKVTGIFSLVASAVAQLTGALTEGPTWTLISQTIANTPGAATWNFMTTVYVLDNPSAGSHQYGLSIAATAGTVIMQSATQQPSMVIVEDVGAFP